MSRRKLELSIGGFALFGLLVYTFVHTGSLLSRWVRPEWIGHVAAFGIEASIVWMSIRIGANRKAGKQTKWLVFVLSVTMFISAIANVTEGFEAFQGELLALNTVGQIDVIQAIVGAFATAGVCLVVFALSEVIGTDVDQAIKQAKRDERKAEQEGEQGEQGEPKQAVMNEHSELIPNSYQSQIYGLLNSGEQLTQVQIAERTGASKATVSKWVKTYEGERANGRH